MRRTALMGVIALGLALGLTSISCTSRLGPVRATQEGGIGRPNLPDIAVEHAKECVADYATQLAPGPHTLDSNVEVNEDGDIVDVTIEGIPNTAPDFAACMRNVLRNMPIAEEPFREGVAKLQQQREQVSVSQKSLVGSPVIVIGVAIVATELALEAGAYTILIGITVNLVAKLSARCRKVRETCIDSCTNSDLPTGTYSGDPYHVCLRQCMMRNGCL